MPELLNLRHPEQNWAVNARKRWHSRFGISGCVCLWRKPMSCCLTPRQNHVNEMSWLGFPTTAQLCSALQVGFRQDLKDKKKQSCFITMAAPLEVSDEWSSLPFSRQIRPRHITLSRMLGGRCEFVCCEIRAWRLSVTCAGITTPLFWMHFKLGIHGKARNMSGACMHAQSTTFFIRRWRHDILLGGRFRLEPRLS